MSAYSSSFSITSRGAGQSAVAHGAYIMRARLLDERDGLTKDYTRGHSAVAAAGILTPDNAPAWAQDIGALLNTIEAGEKRKDAQLTRNILVALPHELTADRREELLKDALDFWVERGAIAAYAIHYPDRDGDDRNHHAHVMLTMRELDGDRFAAKKNREWNSDELATAWRDHWAERGAEYLRRDGFEIEAARYRHGHLDLAAQREMALARGDSAFAQSLDREPTKKMGVAATAMERRGKDSERGAVNREIVAANDRRVIDLAAEREARRARDLSAAAAAAQRDQQAVVIPAAELERDTMPAIESEPEQSPQPATTTATASDQPAPIVPEPPRITAFAQGIKMAWGNIMHRAQHEMESFIGFLGDFFIGSPRGLGSSEPEYTAYKEPEPQKEPEPEKAREDPRQQEQHHAQERAQDDAHAERQQSNLEKAQELLREQERYYAEMNRDHDRDR